MHTDREGSATAHEPRRASTAPQRTPDVGLLLRQLEMTTTLQDCILNAPDETTLLEDACHIMVSVGGYRLSWFGEKGPAPDKLVVPVAQYGYEEGYLDGLDITWSDTEHGRGPTGRAIREGSAQVARDIHRDRRFKPWRTEALKRGYASSCAVPMRVGDEVLGALMLYSDRRDAFDDLELGLLERLTANLAHGIDALRQRRAREQAEARSIELGQAVEHAAWAVAFSTPDGKRIARVNQAFAAMHGADDPAVYEGVPFRDVFPASEHARALRQVARAMEVGHHAFESRHLRQDGTEFPVLVNVTAIHRDGAPAGRIVQVQDITERKHAQQVRARAMKQEAEMERLREADRTRTRIMTEVAHELKNPMTPLRIQLKLLRDALVGRGDEALLRNVTVLERNVGRVTTLTMDLLDASRLSAGRLRLAPRDVNLSALMHAFVDGYVDTAREHGLDLTAEVEPGLRVHADPDRLEQVLLNLVSNARKYTPEGGRVRVEARREGSREGSREGGTVRVAVRDTGVGIPGDALGRIFEPFERGEQPPRQGESSTGLGLYIAHGIVDLHGGTMGVESDGPGEGATFWFTVPAA